MDVGIPVEIEGRFGEYYPGVIHGINSLEELKVNILDPSRSVTVGSVTVPPSSLRLPPELSNFPFDAIPGREVDVLIPFTSSETNGEVGQSSTSSSKLSAWWSGKIKRIAGAFVIVELTCELSREESNASDCVELLVLPNGRIDVPLPANIDRTDVFEKHQLRPRSYEKNLSTLSFYTHTVDIPDGLVTYCRDPSNYQHFAKRCGLPVLVCMAPESFPSTSNKPSDDETYKLNARLLVVSTEQSTVQRAAVIDNTFIDMLRQKVLILQKTEELSQRLEASRIVQQPAPYTEDLYVPENLLPYAIGFQGWNIRQATSIEGIIGIKLDRQSCTFRISGKTQEAVEKAKAMLDYTTEVINVPRSYVGFIVGPGQRHIQHIVDRVGLSGLKISDASGIDQSGFVSFHLTGTHRAIHDIQMFLEFHVASLQELDKLRGIESPPHIHSPQEDLPNESTSTDVASSGDGAGTTASMQGKRVRPAQHGKRRSRPNQLNGGVPMVNGSDTTNTTEPDEDTSRLAPSGGIGGPRRGPKNWHDKPDGSTNFHPPNDVNSRTVRAQRLQSNNSSATVSGHETSDSDTRGMQDGRGLSHLQDRNNSKSTGSRKSAARVPLRSIL